MSRWKTVRALIALLLAFVVACKPTKLTPEEYYRHLAAARSFSIELTSENVRQSEQLFEYLKSGSGLSREQLIKGGGPAEMLRPFLSDMLTNAPETNPVPKGGVFAGVFPLQGFNARTIRAPNGGALILISSDLSKGIYEWAKLVVALATLPISTSDAGAIEQQSREIFAKFRTSLKRYVSSGVVPAFPEYRMTESATVAAVLSASALEYILAHEYVHATSGHIDENLETASGSFSAETWFREISVDAAATKLLLNDKPGGRRLIDRDFRSMGILYCVALFNVLDQLSAPARKDSPTFQMMFRVSSVNKELEALWKRADSPLVHEIVQSLERLEDTVFLEDGPLPPETLRRRTFWLAFKSQDERQMSKLVSIDPHWFAEWAADLLSLAKVFADSIVESGGADWTDGYSINAATAFRMASTIDDIYRQTAKRSAIPQLRLAGRQLVANLRTSAEMFGAGPDVNRAVRDKLTQADDIKEKLKRTFSIETDFWNAMDAYDRKDYLVAMSQFHHAAEAGDAEAQFYTALLYRNGQGVKPDPVAAALWLDHSANQGYDRAQADLGTMYVRGEGVQHDYEAALHWYHLAANQGNGNALYNIGKMYLEGIGVPKDPHVGAQWIYRAAKVDYGDAMMQLGFLYTTGDGAPVDLVKAFAWFAIAAKIQFHPEWTQASPAEFRDAVAKKLTPADKERAAKLAQQWPSEWPSEP